MFGLFSLSRNPDLTDLTMSTRNNNRLPNNLPQLQNCIKRDSVSYKEEFLLQHRRFKALLDVLHMDPTSANKDFEELVMFMAHICQFYTEEMSTFPTDIVSLLKMYGTVLHHDVRMSCCKALILIRNRGLLAATDILSLFFELLKCQDKELRSFLKNHLVTDIKNMNAKHKDVKINNHLQGFMYSMLDESNPIAAKISLDIMVELYKKNVWKDAKTVNVIASACFSKIVKVMVAALSFFLGRDEEDKDDQDSDSDGDNKKTISSKDLRSLTMANKVNKKTNKRKRKKERAEQAAKKKAKKDVKEAINFSALHLIYDPQGMAEKLLKLVQQMNERFEVKLMVMNLISRLVGVHELFLFNFYPLLQRYLQPHQRDVTKILLYTAQACHQVIPSDVLEPVLKTVANNFISERNSTECITVGLNTIREISVRCPLAMNEDLLQDLVQYQKFKDKNVSMAARSLIQLFRVVNPTLLTKKDRGRPTEASVEFKPKEYCQLDAKDYIPGAEVLFKKKQELKTDRGEAQHEESLEEDEDDGWEEVNSGEEDENDFTDDEGWQSFGEEGEDEDDSDQLPSEQESKEDTSSAKKSREEINSERLKEIQEAAAAVSSSRFLTDEEFRLMRKVQLKKQVEAIHPRKKRKKEESESDSEVDSDADDITEKKEVLSLNAIERLYKKSRANKESRLSTVMEGRQGREKFGRRKEKMNPFASKKEKVKKKNKAFNMIKYKVKGKKKKSFQEKQQALKKSLLKQMKQIK